MRLFHHLGAGVWSFLASPAAGLVEGARGRAPERFAAGLAAGLRGLLSNTVYAFSNATAKMSGAARKVPPSPSSPRRRLMKAVRAARAHLVEKSRKDVLQRLHCGR